MKKFLTGFFLLLLVLGVDITANATTYYFSASGNDGNSGTSSSSPWQTLGKFNSIRFNPGDNIYFNRGDVFYGGIIINNSGSSGSSITIGAYGSGSNPVITGFTDVSSWTNMGNNIWESSSSVSKLSTCNMVSVNGTNTPMGRYPNSGYLTFQSHYSNTSLYSSSLSGSPNWAGAEAVIRSTRGCLDRGIITSQSGGTINYNRISNEPANGFGFFIQNDSRTLDQQNEWYYNPSTGKIKIYATSTPTNVRVSSIDNLVNCNSSSYLTFTNISFEGSNTYTIQSNHSKNVTIQNCSLNYCGGDAINTYCTEYLTVQNCNINHSNNFGILAGGYYPSSGVYLGAHALISHNTIANSGVIPGMGNTKGYSAIRAEGAYSVEEYNSIVNTGFIGIFFDGDASIVRNNFIDGFCLLLDDGGGIYSWNDHPNPYNYQGRMIQNNIVINGIGAPDGTDNPTAYVAEGIYLDDAANNVTIDGNSVANCNDKGIHIHNSNNLILNNNTVYNCGMQLNLNNDHTSAAKSDVSNISINNNIFFSKTANQFILEYRSEFYSLLGFYKGDNNYYTRPIKESNAFSLGLGAGTYSSLVWWTDAFPVFQSYFNQDWNSKTAPKTITDTNDLKFVYNETQSAKTISLNANYIDVKNQSYNGSITLAPFTSAVLIKNGPATAEVKSMQLSLVTKTDVSCKGGTNGTIQVITTGGSGPYTYNINYGAFNSNNIFNSLQAGTYKIYSRDNTGQETLPLEVTIADGINQCGVFQINIAQKDDATCKGGSDGHIQVIPTGGTTPYTYNINYGPFTSNNNFTNLAPGSYIIYAHDKNGGETSLTATIADGSNQCNNSFKINVQSKSDVNCLGGSDGQIQIVPSGGTPPFTYNIDYGAFTGSNVFSNLAAGTYIIYAHDANGVETSLSSTIKDGTKICSFEINLANKTDVSCQGGSDGSIQIIPSGGTPPYTYNINFGRFTSSNVFSYLSAGSYRIYARDAKGVEAASNATIADGSGVCGSFKIQLASKTDVSCLGGSNGSIQVIPSGGQGPYTYNINFGPFSSNNYFTNLPSRGYVIYARDKNGVESSVRTNIKDGVGPCPLSFSNNTTSIARNISAFEITVTPNPTIDKFILNVKSSDVNQKIYIEVLDVNGQRFYQANGQPNSQYTFGNNFISGVYLVRVIQGNNLKILKLVKAK